MPTSALGAKDLTRRLFASVAAESATAANGAHASRIASERTCRDLARSLGSSGFNALLTRALSQAEVEHPLLKEIRVGRGADPLLGGIDELVARHGAPAVDAALESMLSEMLALLGRLIGDDMVPRLVEHHAPEQTPDDQDGK